MRTITDLLWAKHFLKVFIRNYCMETTSHFPRQVFSAIQPTGEIHLGNYLGAIKKWIELQKTEENVVFCIADLHSMALPKNRNTISKNIFHSTATLLATGIDVKKSIFYKQSDVHQHSELCWILGTLCTMARLSNLPQFKEKSAQLKEVPVGLFLYPILQAADIALYKATHVPVGKDQQSHIILANELIRSFNRNFGLVFPYANALIGTGLKLLKPCVHYLAKVMSLSSSPALNQSCMQRLLQCILIQSLKFPPVVAFFADEHTGSIKSLKEPSKKMSKSGKPKSTINLTDSPDTIRTVCVKALTDFTSAVSYDPENRPGISNLLLIHSQLTGKSIDIICKESENLNTGQYKSLLADVIVETLKPIREEIHRYLQSEDYLENILRSGAEKACEKAEVTMREVRDKIGIKVGMRNVTQDMALKVTTSLK